MAKFPNIPRPSVSRPQMEVYTSAHAKSWMWNALPGPVTTLYSLAVAGSVTGLAYYFGDMGGREQGQTWSMIAIAVMTVIGLISGFFSARKAKREQEAAGGDFEEALKSSASGWGDEVSDPGEIAKLDDLRRNFQMGIETFRSYGRDVYSMPWYVIMGEPGSGKSEAIRRSELKFPEALQDKLQGTGGTYSMHWWFTNHAIILDTAGAMLTSPEAAGRFEEFLNLLKGHRPDCPINGMILTIPTDSLLQDPPPVAEQKAKVIANQLAVIQKALDVRFPIYIMVSKSDRLPGFREYFDAEGQASFERQMMGWSNPDPLGTAFAPERISESLDTIAMRLQSRALALLADPVSPNPGARRMDEVDSVYTFPNVIRSLAPRLRLYLNVLFQTGAWSAKPPFFRGIYFTSALREGGQLDQVLAQALGMPLNQLPAGGIFAREKSVFLRDVFMEKVFMERGLVTRLADVGAHLRKRLMTFYGATAALLALALVGGMLVQHKLAKQLEDEQVQWSAANSSWDNGTLLAMVKRTTVTLPDNTTRPQWVWAGSLIAKAKENGGSNNAGVSRLAHLKALKERTEKPLSLGWFFWPVPEWSDFMDRRKEGYLTVFEGSAMKPLLDAARERILWDTAKGNSTGAETNQKLAGAYVELLEMELWLSGKSTPKEEDWNRWFTTLVNYVTAESLPGGGELPPSAATTSDKKHSNDDLKALAQLADSVYGSSGLMSLPARSWMSEVQVPAIERALDQGKGLLLGISQKVSESQSDAEQKRTELEGACRAFLTAEKQLDQIQQSGAAVPIQQISTLMKSMYDNAGIIDRASGNNSASAASVFKDSIVKIQEKTHQLKDLNPLFEEIDRQAEKVLAGGAQTTANHAIDAELQTSVLDNGAYRMRLQSYNEALRSAPSATTSQVPQNMLGKLGESMTAAMNSASTPAAVPPQTQAAPAAEEKPGYNGPLADMWKRITHDLLPAYRQSGGVDAVLDAYRRQVVTKLQFILQFPLVTGRPEFADPNTFVQRCAEVALMDKDFQDFDQWEPKLKPSQAKEGLTALRQKMKPVISIVRSLYDDASKAPRTIKVTTSAGGRYSEVPQMQQPPAVPALPGAAPAPPPPPKIISGFDVLRVEMTDGQLVVASPDNVKEGQVPCYVGFAVAATYKTDKGTSDLNSTEYKRNWGILKHLSTVGRNCRPNNSTVLSISFDCTPPLTVSPWPSYSSFAEDFRSAGITPPR